MSIYKYKLRVSCIHLLSFQSKHWAEIEVGHDGLLKPDISVQDLFGQLLKALLNLNYPTSISQNPWGSWERMVLSLHSCSAERGLHGQACYLGRMLLRARAFPSSGEKPPTLLTALSDVGISHCLHSFDSFSWLLFCFGTCLKRELSAP